ncbi:SDR family oxidoreductase [Pedobacter miscanthi]|uniref:SDR family NAD(P)-dependent oxidoreductase n=1 Tax=Pedobacter miscanthi TaxID=2259170 RepID=A0A366KYR5_9SPHI|nr:SDR family oxidoreductase [Pedobacter miscanthi]RBQ06728.1 SDR family NAD(P)-dependent oxidoreductase [Pedobacter miscanthi]
MSKVIVITGTSSGFGTLMVKKFSSEGFKVVATMRGSQTKNIAVAGELSALPGVEVMELDVAEDNSVKTAISSILKKYGKIDVMINNAAIQGMGLLEAYSLEQFQKIMNINVFGVLRVYRELLPAMRKERDGLIINVSSNAGRFSPPFQVPYNSSKFALEGITEGGYDELIGQGIETVIIEPGAFMTEMYTKQGTHADREEILAEYGEQTAQMMAGFGAQLGNALQKHQPDAAMIADAALALVNMDKKTRPLRTSVDPIAQGVDYEYNNSASELKAKWVSKYMS